MDRRAADAVLAQLAADEVRAVLAVGEDDHALRALALEDLPEQALLGVTGGAEHVLLDGLGGGALRRDLDAGGVAHERLGVVEHVVVEGGREEQRLALIWAARHDLAHVGQEAHVEHAVGLVQHEHLDAGEVAGALLDEVDQTSGRGYEQVDAALEGLALRLVGEPAHDDGDVVVRLGADGGRDVLDLLGELARRREHEHEGALAAPGVGEGVEGGEEEGGGLAGAGLGGRHHVPACEDLGDGLGLHGGGQRVAEPGHRLEGVVGEAEPLERGGRAALAGGGACVVLVWHVL